MGNYERAVIECNDKGIMKEIEKMYKEESHCLSKETANVISIKNRGGHTDKQLLKLSGEYKGINIIGRYNLELDRYSRTYTIIYKDGKSGLMDVSIQYSYSYMDKTIEFIESIGIDFKDKIFDELDKLYKRMDTVTQNVWGEFEVDDNIDKEIIVILEIENYKIKASKRGSEIDIQEVEKLLEIEDLGEKIEYAINEDLINLPF